MRRRYSWDICEGYARVWYFSRDGYEGVQSCEGNGGWIVLEDRVKAR